MFESGSLPIAACTSVSPGIGDEAVGDTRLPTSASTNVSVAMYDGWSLTVSGVVFAGDCMSGAACFTALVTPATSPWP